MARISGEEWVTHWRLQVRGGANGQQEGQQDGMNGINQEENKLGLRKMLLILRTPCRQMSV